MKKNLGTIILVAATALAGTGAFVGCAHNRDRDAVHKRTTGQYIDDKVLGQRVRSALGDTDVYKFPHVDVNTYKGTVQLSGFVTTEEQKQKAEEIARRVEGVLNVQNNITMKSDTERVRGTSSDQNMNTTTTTDHSTSGTGSAPLGTGTSASTNLYQGTNWNITPNR